MKTSEYKDMSLCVVSILAVLVSHLGWQVEAFSMLLRIEVILTKCMRVSNVKASLFPSKGSLVRIVCIAEEKHLHHIVVAWHLLFLYAA